MRYTEGYFPTLREAPQDTETLSHKLLLRAGYIRKEGSGVFALLPLGVKTIERLESLFEEKLSNAGGIKFYSSSLKSGQDIGINEGLNEKPFVLNDIHDKSYFLADGICHEDMKLLAYDINSYKELPKLFFQYKEMFRDSIRPRLGLIKSRNFKTVSGFALAKEAEELTFVKGKVQRAFEEVFKKLELNFIKSSFPSPAHKQSEDLVYLIPNEAGDIETACCQNCGTVMLKECFPVDALSQSFAVSKLDMEKIHTPEARTIDDLTKFFNCSPDRFVKTLIFEADGEIIAALVRGDRELSEFKLKRVLGCTDLKMADEAAVRKATGAEIGFAGPVNIKARIVSDIEVYSMNNFIAGANQSHYHLINVNPGRDFEAELIADIRDASEGDVCASCKEALKFKKNFIIGEIKGLNKITGQKLGLCYLNDAGKQDYMECLTFNVNLYSLLALLIEQVNDENGIIMPEIIAPFDVHVIIVNNKDDKQTALAQTIYEKLKKCGAEVLLDDRNERAGVKFKDSELLGIPVRITVGKRAEEGIVEYKRRTGELKELTVEEAISEMGVV